jgi:hypothetical protein
MDEDKKKKTGEVEHDENEGEGSYSATRDYERDVDEFLQENDPSKLARNAASDIERDPEGYEAAEREGKSRSAGDLETDKDVI